MNPCVYRVGHGAFRSVSYQLRLRTVRHAAQLVLILLIMTINDGNDYNNDNDDEYKDAMIPV